VHVDEGFIRRVTHLYRQRIPPGASVLDLMSSWVSHLPPDRAYAKVVGHGMNAAEAGALPTALNCELFTNDYRQFLPPC
jgi:hypothetical protein